MKTSTTKAAMPVKTVTYTPPPQTGDDSLDLLLRMMTYARRHDSEGERLFVEVFLQPYLPKNIDGWAWRIDIPLPDGEASTTMFSSHVDTVHPSGHALRQSVDYDTNLALILPGGDHVLGADDAAGVWLMLQMIDAGVPGCYVFHRGEERGGLGSDYLAANHSDFIAGFDRAVAFDRRGTGDVITHQGFGRCCSDAFAKALAGALNEHGLDYKPDDGGVFTDTANYTDLVAECTNLSVGYEYEHTSNEMLDVEHIMYMRDAVIKIDWEALPTKRKPGDDGYGSYGRWPSMYYSKQPTSPMRDEPAVSLSDLYDMDYRELTDAIYDYPEHMADIVWELLWGHAVTHDGVVTDTDEEV